MEKIAKYRKAVLNLLDSYRRTSNGVETFLITDNEQNHYQVVEAGWQDPDRYFYSILFHIHIKSNGKVYILENNTEDDLAVTLLEHGVIKTDIILNFVPERVRKQTGYATV